MCYNLDRKKGLTSFNARVAQLVEQSIRNA